MSPMAAPIYNAIKNSRKTCYFGMNQVNYLIFGKEDKVYHLIDGLNGCFGVFLIPSTATISAYIPPHPGKNFQDQEAGDKNLITRIQEFAKLY